MIHMEGIMIHVEGNHQHHGVNFDSLFRGLIEARHNKW